MQHHSAALATKKPIAGCGNGDASLIDNYSLQIKF